MSNKRKLKVRVTNQFVTYDHENDIYYYRTDIPISTYVKHGYMAYDMSGRNIGIIYSCDGRKNLPSYGNCQFEFRAPLRSEFGIWRIITVNGAYLPFSRLENILEIQSEYEFTAEIIW